MSETHELLSQYFPVRPHVITPIPDGTLSFESEDLSQFVGVYPFAFTPTTRNLDYYTNQNITPYYKIILSDLDNGNEADISAFVIRWGSIKRSIDYLIGKMSPSSHNFTLSNTKDPGDFLFTLRKNLGLEYWMGKEYDLYVGWMDGVDITWFNIYTGKITSKMEDRINGNISVSSHDVIKELNDFKTCNVIKGSDVFEYSGSGTDIRSIQQVIRYGTHKLITNGGNKELTKRDNPFTTTEGVFNLYNEASDKIGGSSTYNKYYLWYFPLINWVDRVVYDSGNYKAYYWDYIDNRWISFTTDNFTSDDIAVPFAIGDDLNGIYFRFENSSMTMDNSSNFSTFESYVNPTDPDYIKKFDPAIVIETTSNSISAPFFNNPVVILFGLLTDERFINYDSTVLDYQSFSSPDILEHTWDKSFNFFNNENGEINIAYDNEISLMEIINEVCYITGLSFFASRKGRGYDRRIKLIENSPINPVTYPLKQNQITLSTQDKINSLTLHTDSSKQKNQVIAFNFDSSMSTKESFDAYVEEEITSNEFVKSQSFGGAGSKVYFYDSSALAQANLQRYFQQLKYPPEIIKIDCGKAGFEIEVGDLVDIHDSISNETNTTRVHNTTLTIKPLGIKLETKKFMTQFGPDPEKPCKLWAFADYAYATDIECDQGGGYNGHSYYAY